MGKIKILSENVSNRIAAGEVIERPFSVVKELVENSIDAKATQINVNVVNGGRDLIQVIDNGKGMSEDDAQLAFERHATSKIRNEDDIIHVNTLGFRGEAIPSIASVSNFTLITKTEAEDTATEIIYDSGKLITVRQTSATTGTQITVKKLFVNVPARRKFLKTEPVEFKHILNYMHYQSVLYPKISFKLTHNGRERFNYPAVETIDQRLLDIFGSSFGNIDFLRIEKAWNSIKMNAYIELIENTEKRVENIKYLFINGRYINDKTVFAAMRSALEPFLKKYSYFQSGNLPMYIIFLEIDPEMVDVNVHPAKLEIRFRENQLVYQFVRQTIIDAINQYEKDKYEVVKQKVATTNPESPITSFEKQIINKTINRDYMVRKEELIKKPLIDAENRIERGEEHIIYQSPAYFESPKQDQLLNNDQAASNSNLTIVKKPLPLGIYGTIFDNIDEYSNLWQVNFLYIFMQDETGIYVIDQHAAHERIIYEKMIRRMQGETAIRQRLLFPIVIDLPHYLAESIFSLIEENIHVFEQIGFNIKTFSQNSIVIDEIPTELEGWDGGDIFIDLIKQLQEEFSELEDFRDSLAKSMACKAAVKAGKRLQKREMVVLIKELYTCKEPFYCPHGRPLIIKIEYTELEKRFKRI
ncbi:MAG TPA: DNA mismatch repair endonuclease MutL [Candidatus Cloacimonadota bacterium]|nr:DNA mismatch repair endonuclease MutL [Candidatus Cloacimonadota bacterium]HQB41621.1 DNA mismatch repair endonuclease MutL [Candidatus Cloacimonadota bacterium]